MNAGRQEHSCCSSTAGCATAIGQGVCPVSGRKGTPVELRTPKSLLTDASRLGEGPFYFCPDPDCDVVYFDASGGEVYRKVDLNVRVGQKETEDPVPVCYCFDFTRAMLHEEIERTGETSIPHRIKDEIAAGNCACEVKNPQGSCCLGNVNVAVRAIQAERETSKQGKSES